MLNLNEQSKPITLWVALSLILLTNISTAVQGQTLSGNVIDSQSNAPVDSVVVALENHTATSMTNANGRFQLNTSGCRSCSVGDEVKLILIDSRPDGYGYHILERVISSDYSLLVKIQRNNYKIVKGEVFAADDGEPLSRIIVTCLPEIDIGKTAFPETVTNDIGMFILPVRAAMIADKRYLRMIYSDPAGMYKHKSVLTDVRTELRVELHKRAGDSYNLTVIDSAQLEYKLYPGQQLRIRAAGKSTLSSRGALSETQRMSRSDKALQPIHEKWPPGALLFKLSTEDEHAWRPLDHQLVVDIDEVAQLQLMVNAVQTSENQGAYDVQVLVE